MICADDLQGHWRRDWIKGPGFEDHTTRVHWLQAGALYADIRIPADRPDLAGYACLAEVPADLCAELLGAEGFAGTISVADGHCTWAREINWQGVPEGADIGRMSFDGPALIEDGVLAEYRERWVAMTGPPLRAHRVRLAEGSGILIESDTTFLIGLGQPPAPPRDTRARFASTYAYGHWEGTEGRASLSTNPFCEGRVVLRREGGFTWHAPDFDGDTCAHRLST